MAAFVFVVDLFGFSFLISYFLLLAIGSRNKNVATKFTLHFMEFPTKKKETKERTEIENIY